MMFSPEVRPEIPIRNTPLFSFMLEPGLLPVLWTPFIRPPILMRLPPLHVTVAALLFLLLHLLPLLAPGSHITPVPALPRLIAPVIRPSLLLRVLLILLPRLRRLLRLFWVLRRLRSRLLRFLRSIRWSLTRMLILRHPTQRRSQYKRKTNPAHHSESLHSCPRIILGYKPDAEKKGIVVS